MINAVETNPVPDSVAPAANKPKSGLDFMGLLVKQIQTQNPMDPMSNQEMLNQLTQTQMVEQISGLRSDGQTALRSGALAFIGKNVTGTDKADAPVSGVVTGVMWSSTSKEPDLLVGSAFVPLKNVTRVAPQSPAAAKPGAAVAAAEAALKPIDPAAVAGDAPAKTNETTAQ
jgi:flagellar basal-body rod modification protein FlgD